MMEYIEKLKVYGDQVKNVVVKSMVDTAHGGQKILKDVMPGNLVTREYELIQPLGSAGPGLLWRIYGAIKSSTRQEAAVFVLQKRLLDKYPRKDRELILDAMRKGVQQLAKIKHPRILGIQHPLEESRDSLAFATESCLGSLANCLGFLDNIALPIPKEFEDYQLSDVEIRYGILQLCDGLSFLHNEVRLLHRNISPESIIINVNGAWKFIGFELCVQGSADGSIYPFRDYDGTIPPIINPRLEYMAPEYVTTKSYDSQADMFSVGMLLYALYNHGRALYQCNDNYPTFMKCIEELKTLNTSKLSNLPLEACEHVKMLLSIKPELRPDAGQLVKVPFFQDVAIKTLEYLDSLFQVDHIQRSMFYKSLPQVIDKLPMRVNLQRITAALELEFISPEMVPVALPNMFLIAEKANNEEYRRYIFPKLKQVFKLQKPAHGGAASGGFMQTLLILMRNMKLMLTKTPPDDIKQYILPVVYNALDAESPQVQELCLAIIPSFAHLIDLQAMKYAILPRIKKICFETITLSVRVNCLICLGKLVESLDKWVIVDEVLPLLQSIPSREPAVLMAILGIIKVALASSKSGGIPREVLATKIIPFLIPLSIETSLSINQFNTYISTIKDMLQTVEFEQRRKLEQLSQQAPNAPIIPISTAQPEFQLDKSTATMIDEFLVGHGFTSEVAQNKSMSAVFDNGPGDASPKLQKQFVSPAKKPETTETPLTKKTLTLEEKERMMRQNEQPQFMSRQGELVPQRKPSLVSPTNTNTNAPLMTLTPTVVSSTASSSPSTPMKDLTSSLFDPNAPTQSFPSISTSQTMPSLVRPSMPLLIPPLTSTLPIQQQTQQTIRPTQNFSSPSNSKDLTASLMNNINSLGSRTQTTSTGTPMNTMTTRPSMPSSNFNSGSANSGALFQPPPPPGSTVVKGSSTPSGVTTSKTAASEIDDLFN